MAGPPHIGVGGELPAGGICVSTVTIVSYLTKDLTRSRGVEQLATAISSWT